MCLQLRRCPYLLGSEQYTSAAVFATLLGPEGLRPDILPLYYYFYYYYSTMMFMHVFAHTSRSCDGNCGHPSLLARLLGLCHGHELAFGAHIVLATAGVHTTRGSPDDHVLAGLHVGGLLCLAAATVIYQDLCISIYQETLYIFIRIKCGRRYNF